jgi:diguanylate cyclase (GGDEF)-like protein
MLENRIINSSKKSIMKMGTLAFFAFFIVMLVAFSIIYITVQKSYSVKFYEDALKRSIHTKSIQIINYFEADWAILHAMSKSPVVTAFLADKNDTNVQEIFWKEFNNYKSLISGQKKVFFVSKMDNRFYFDTNYAYTVNESLPSAYWYDSSLNKTNFYNFNVDYDPNLGSAFIWINFPVFNHGDAIGVIGLGVDISSFVGEMQTKTDEVKNFIAFNENGEILLHEDYNLIKNKNNVYSILPGATIDSLIELSSKGRNNELLIKDGYAYMIENLPFMQCYLVASEKIDFMIGQGNLYLLFFSLILGLILLFLIFLYEFVKTIVGPLHYFSSLTKTLLKEFPINIAFFSKGGKAVFISRHLSETMKRDISDLPDYLKEIEKKKGFFEITKEFEKNNGKSSYFKVVKMDIEQSEDNEQNSIIYLSNVSEQMYLANTDSLTNIANRRYFNDRSETEFYNSQRDKTPISFIMLDIDSFKKFNDKFGHLTGDEILKEVANILSEVVERKTDLVGRFGGEEFAVMLHNTNLEGAITVAEKICSAIAKKEFLVGKTETVRITASLGVYSNVPNSFDDLKSFLNEADLKLYEAKKAGKNRVCW